MKKTNYFFFSSFVKQISYYILPVLALLLWQPGFSQQGILSIDGNASINIPAGTCMGSSQGVVNITFQNVSSSVNSGTINNNGTVECKGTWTNNSTTPVGGLVTTGTGTVVLDGGTQTITGTTATTFNNLSLGNAVTQTGTVTLTGVSATVTGVLSLQNFEFATGINLLTISTSGSITRGTGFISSLPGGYLAENTNSTSTYFFPVGKAGGGLFRPVGVSPATTTSNTYKVRFVANSPTTDGYTATSTDGSVCTVNTAWYHQVIQTGADQAILTMYYSSAIDGIFSTMVHWQGTPVWTNMAPVTLSTGSYFGLTNNLATNSAWSNFTSPAFALATPLTPTVPVATAASNIICSGFTANWNASTNATNYFIDVALDAGFSSIVDNNVSVGNATSFGVTGLTSSTNYYYQVRAQDACGTSTSSNIIGPVTTSSFSTLSYTSNTVTYCAGQAITGNTPIISGGGSATGYSAPSLPAGLSISPTTGVISGTPTAIAGAAQTSFTVTATTTCGGNATDNVLITISPAMPASLTYAHNPVTYCAGQSITTNSPSTNLVTGGPATSYSATLPAGLAIDPVTGIISGTPTTTAGITASNYSVTATNGCGSTTLSTLNITISPATPSGLTYSTNPATYCYNTAIATNTPSYSASGGAPTSYSVLPALPAGLTLNSNGTITGTPTTSTGLAAANYVITATNSCGSTTATVSISIGLANTAGPATVTASAPVVCSGSTVTLTETGGSLGIDNVNNVWAVYDGSCAGTAVTSVSSTSTSVTITPTAGAHTYYVKGTGCGTTSCQPVGTYVFASAGTATVTPTQPGTCTSSGSIVFSNASGGASTWINSTLGTGSAPANVTINGNASWQTTGAAGPRCMLTSATNSQNSSMVVVNPNNYAAAGFRTELDLDIIPGSSADGFSISYGPSSAITSTTIPTNGEQGVTNTLIASFSTYAHGSGEFNAANPGIYLAYQGTLYYSNTINSDATFYNAGWVHVVFSVTSAGAASLTITNTSGVTTTVFSGVQLPATYTGISQSGWNWCFGARTGGSNEECDIRNLNITALDQYQYADQTTNWQSSPTFSPVAGGTYTHTANIALQTLASPGCTTYPAPADIVIQPAVVNPQPIAPANPSIVFGGGTVQLSDATTGGTWSSATTADATVNGSGLVTGVLPGSSVITYTTATGGCTATTTVNVTTSSFNGITPSRWYRGDLGVTASSGSVSAWQDYSGNNQSATNTGNYPQYSTTAYNINYNPTLNFNNEWLNFADAGLPTGSAGRAIFGVATSTTNSGSGAITGYGNWCNNGAQFVVQVRNTNFYIWNYGGDFNTGDNAFATVNTPVLWYAGGSGGTDYAAVNGAVAATDVLNNLNTSLNFGLIGAGNGCSGGSNWSGDIGELIYFNSLPVSATTKQEVESYLAIKYGVTKDQTSGNANSSYLNSTGTSTWTSSSNTGYLNNIAGIGKDQNWVFLQNQSTSINSGTEVTIGSGSIASTNALNTSTSITDQSYLIWGDNAGSVSSWTSGGAPAGRVIIARTWKEQVTGTPGSVQVQIAASALPATTNPQTVLLEVSSSGSFSSGATEYAMTLSGGKWTTTSNVTFTSGQYFTFATQGPTTITVQPVTPTTICSGSGTATISVTAAGTALTFQWQKGGVNISGSEYSVNSTATTSTLTINPATSADAGTYTVIVTGTFGPAVTSNPVILAVGVPAVANTPSPANGATGQAVSGTLNWASVGATSYNVWFGNGTSTLTEVSVGQTGTTYAYSTNYNSTTMYWRIDAVNACGTTTGTVWTFTTVAPTFVTGANSWYAPPGVNCITVQAWGAGAAGTGVYILTGGTSGGGGGGGGFAQADISVVPTNQYTVYVGAGGTGNQSTGANGGPSWFQAGSSSTYSSGPVFAAAGLGSGAGGTANIATGFNTVTYSGGAGSGGYTNVAGGAGGGGGGGAGSTGNGGNGGGSSDATPGTGGSGGGGIGGAGGTYSGPIFSVGGNSGSTYGGGGGGAIAQGINTGNNGGNGGAGQVVITFKVAPAAPIVGAITQPTCAAPTGSVALSGLPATGTWIVTANPGGVTATGTGTTTGTISGLAPNTTYTFTVANSCISSAASNPAVINAVPALPVITSVTTTQPTCAVPTGSITIVSAGSNQYSINNGTTFTNTTGSFSGIAPSSSANIEVRLVADNTCVTTYANNPVIINPAPGAAANPVIAGGSSEPICGIIGAPTTVYTTSAAYSATYNWSVSAGGAVTNTSISNSGTATSSSNATVTWTNGFVGSTTISVSDGCTPVATRSITLSPYVTPAVSIDPTPNYIVCSTDQIHFTATPSGTGGATPTYQWKINGTNVGSNSATYTDNAPADGAVVTCVMTSNYACPTPGTNPATSNSTTVVVGVCNNTWNGSVAGDNTNWDNPGNWNANHVPANCADQANIPPGLTYYPVLTHAESVGDIILQQPGGNVNLGNYNLSVCGNITVETTTQAPASVTIPSTGGVIVLDGITGTSTQTVSGSVTAYEVKVNTQATGGIVLASGAGVSVFNALDLQQGNIDISQGSFTFESTGVSQAAILDNFSYGNNPGTITGSTVKSERYYAISGYTYTHQHMLGSPVNGEFLSQMGAGTTSGYVIPTGDCDEYWSGANTPYGNVFSLDQSHGASCGMAQWYVEPGTAPAVVGKGYSVVLAGTGVLSLTGSANVGSSYTLSPLANSNWVNTTYEHHTLSSGWQLVSNPYQATLALNTGNPGMDGQVQVWQANGPFVGTYQPGMVGSVNIAPFQAFMVHVTTPGNMTASYTINGADRVRTPATFYNQNANELDITAANLGNNLLDKTVVAFNPHATDSFDTQYDANKIPGSEGRHVLYTTLSDGKWIGINTLRDVATTSTVPVGFEPGSNGNYSFTFDKVNTFDPTTYIFLEDKQQQVMYNVRSGDYLFSSDTADNWNRFVLHFTPPAVISSMDAGCNSLGAINVSQPGTASWNYTLSDGGGTVISSGVLNQNSPLSINEPAGSYTLTLVDNNNYTVTKVIQLNGAQPVTAAFAPSANNVNTQTAVSFGNTSQNANTYSWNFGDGSTSGLVSPVHTYTAPGIYTVELTATNSSGCSSTTGQSITVNSVATGINNVVSENGISLWSNKNNVYVDFSNAGSDVNAVIKIYDVLGQEISEDKYTLNGLYQKEIDNIEAAYVIVAVNNNDKITTKKLFINNIAK